MHRNLFLPLVVLFIMGCSGQIASKETYRIEDKTADWCPFLKQNKVTVVLANYQGFASIEAAVRNSFEGQITELQRWDQGGSSIATHIVEWQRAELFGTAYYVISLNNDEPLQAVVTVREPVPINSQDILNCLGTPDYYAIEPYLFSFSGYDEHADNVFLYYVAQDIELQVIKPQSQNIYDNDVNLHFSRLYVYPKSQLLPTLMSLTDYPSKDELKVWENP